MRENTEVQMSQGRSVLLHSHAVRRSVRALLASLAVFALAAGALAGTVTYTFDWYLNAAVSDFPVPIALEEGVNGFTYAGFADAENGSDLRAYDSDSSPLPLEIETWNPAGKSVVWVKVPSFSNATAITLSWGDPTASTTSADGMWGAAMAVMHFGDDEGLNSAHGDYLSRVPGGATVVGVQAPVGVGAQFNRTGVYCADSASAEYCPETTNVFTVSFWLKTDKFSREDDQTYLIQWGRYYNEAKTLSSQVAVLLNWYADSQISMYKYDSQSSSSFSPPTASFPSDGLWHHVAYTYDGSTCTVYVDGNVKKTSSFSGFQLDAWGEHGGYFSVGGTGNSLHTLDGNVDELRFERVCRSADWIRAEVETQAHHFYGRRILFSDYIGAVLTNFPAYLHVDENMGLDPAALYSELTNGTAQIRDLRTGALLPVEIEYWFNTAYDKSLGMWVKMPFYSSSDGVVISAPFSHYVPDGAAAAGNEVNPSEVWSSDDFLLVFHMNPTGYLHDVKSNVRTIPNYKHNNGEYANAYPFAAEGPTGPYQAYRSTTNAVQTVKPTIERAITNVYTISWWMKEDADEFEDPKSETYVWTLLGVSALKGYGYRGSGANKHTMVIYTGASSATLDVPDAGWHHYAYAFDGQTTFCYRDGALVKSASGGKNFGFTSAISNKLIHLCGSSNAAKDAYRGNFDEIRLETVCRGADWINATYLNQLAWKDGTAWQLAPHFAEEVSALAANGGVSATAALSCRTNATVALCWGRADGGEDSSAWTNYAVLGSKTNGLVTGSATSLEPGVRYAVRFHATNEFGEAWSEVGYAMVPTSGSHGAEVPITVNYAEGETLEDFPLCVRIPASNGLPDDPAKVRIVDSDGEALAWEAETWDPEGESVLWVRVPSLSGEKRLILKFHDSFPSDDGDWDAGSVWPASKYVGVWHFASSAKSGVVTKDSSALGADIVNNTLGAYATNGVAGESYYWPRAEGTVGGMTAASGGVPFNDFRWGFTFSFWASIPDNETCTTAHFAKHELVARTGLPSGFYNQYIIRYEGTTANTIDFFVYNLNGKLFPQDLTNTYLLETGGTETTQRAVARFTSIVKPDEDWHHYAFVHDGMWLCAYLDGALQGMTFWPFVLNTAVQNYVMMKTAFGNNVSQYNLAKGSMDEYRVERVGRSAAWIKACYDNLKPGSEFVTVGNTRYPGTLLMFR